MFWRRASKTLSYLSNLGILKDKRKTAPCSVQEQGSYSLINIVGQKKRDIFLTENKKTVKLTMSHKITFATYLSHDFLGK